MNIKNKGQKKLMYIKMRMNKFIFLVGIAFQISISSFAQESKSSEQLGDAASNATNPMAFVTKLQVQPNFDWKEAGGRQINLTTRIIQPTASIFLPFIKSKDPSKVYTLYRLEFPIISQTLPANPSFNATGLGDVTILNLVAFKQKWGLLGAGSGLIIPTVTPTAISGGKWCAGLTGVVLNTKTKGLQYGVLVQQFFSFAGSSSRSPKNFMLLQPIFNKVLGQGYFMGVSPIMTLDWENSTTTIPISVSIGKAFAKNLSAFIAPQYVLSGPTKGDFILQFQINAMFPPSAK
jgi:hypothetical protein